jgi:transcription elongation factor SPT5
MFDCYANHYRSHYYEFSPNGATIPALEYSPGAFSQAGGIAGGAGINGYGAGGYGGYGNTMSRYSAYGGAGSGSVRRSVGAQTPFYGASGGKTPNPYSSNGGRTPAWDAGNRTPAWDAGNRTPAWNATGSRTPAWNTGNRTPAWSGGGGSDSWNSGAATPQRFDSWNDNVSSNTSNSAAFPSTPGPTSTDISTDAPTPQFPSTPGPNPFGTQQTEASTNETQSNSGKLNVESPHKYLYITYVLTRCHIDVDIRDTDWPTENICVRIVPHYKTGAKWSDGDYDGDDAVITRVQPDGTCVLRMSTSRELVQGVPKDFMIPITPQKKDQVKVLVGKHRGQIGELVGVDNMDAIVKTADMKEFGFLKLSELGKYQPDM